MKYDNKTNFLSLRNLAVKVGAKLNEDPKKPKIGGCSSSLYVYKNTDSNTFHFMRYRCKDRFCPICNHVTSTTLSTYMLKQYEQLKDEYNFISLTLTCKNVDLSELKSTQKAMFHAFSMMMQNARRNLGKEYAYLRTYECTYNGTENTFHPHLHVLLCYPKNIPLKTISKFDFGGLFARNLHNNNLTAFGVCPDGFGQHICCLDKITEKYHTSVTWDCEEYNPQKSSLFEFTKYLTKFSDLVNKLDDLTFQAFYKLNSQVKVHTCSGAWRGYLKQMDDELDESVYLPPRIIQNNHYVYCGVLHCDGITFCCDFLPYVSGSFDILLSCDDIISLRQFVYNNLGIEGGEIGEF